jgi:hypothetical protein
MLLFQTRGLRRRYSCALHVTAEAKRRKGARLGLILLRSTPAGCRELPVCSGAGR